jgi:energy-coupling factor transport system permease protein
VNARAVAAWSAACLFIALFTTNPAYKLLVLAAAFTALAATAGLRRMRRLVIGVALIAAFDALLNFVSAHLGRTVLFALPDSVPALGGPYTLEALAFGVSGGVTIAAAIFAAAPFSLLLDAHEVMDALPGFLSRTGTAIAASVNLVPAVATSFTEVSEAQRLRGWRPRGPRSWAEVVVPVVLTTAEGSIQLAESMEARGFGGARRTSFEATRLATTDWLLVAASAVATIGFVLAHAAGWAADWYAYPALTAPKIDAPALLACLLLFTPVLTWRRHA